MADGTAPAVVQNALQTKANHTRIDPAFHYVLLPLILVVLVWSIIHEVRHPGTERVILIAVVFLLGLTALKARMYAAKVQDRVIRLEERLRLTALLPEGMRHRVPELTESQLIALRFASDAEVAGLAQRAVNEKLTNRQIKDAIQNWRPDYWRV